MSSLWLLQWEELVLLCEVADGFARLPCEPEGAQSGFRAEAPCMRIATVRAPYAIACSPLNVALVGAAMTRESI